MLQPTPSSRPRLAPGENFLTPPPCPSLQLQPIILGLFAHIDQPGPSWVYLQMEPGTPEVSVTAPQYLMDCCRKADQYSCPTSERKLAATTAETIIPPGLQICSGVLSPLPDSPVDGKKSEGAVHPPTLSRFKSPRTNSTTCAASSPPRLLISDHVFDRWYTGVSIS